MKYIQYLNVNILKMKILTNFIIFKNIILFLFNIINKKLKSNIYCLLKKPEVPASNPLVAFVKFFSLILSY